MELSSKDFFGNDVSEFKIYSTQYDGIRYLQWIESQLANFSAFKGAILADDMGLGKTRQIIGLCEISRVKLTLILCTKSTRFAWYREALNTAKRCMIYTIKDGVYASVTLNKINPNVIDVTTMGPNFYPGIGSTSIVIINYELLTEKNAKLINKSQWDRIAADEAHALRNGESKIIYNMSQNINQPMINGNRIGSRIAISGTPINNDKSDIVSLFRWIDNRSFSSTRINDDEIYNMIRKYLFRRNKNQITPELKVIMKYPVEKPLIHRQEIRFIDTELSRYLQNLDFEQMKSFLSNPTNVNLVLKDEKAFYIVLSTNIRNDKLISNGKSDHLVEKGSLRYALSCPYDVKNKIPLLQNKSYVGKSTRIENVISILEQNDDNFVIFHRFEEIGLQLIKAIKIRFPHYHISEINGKTDDKMRESILFENQKVISEGRKSILISSIQATSEGLNYQFYSKMIIVDQDWNPKVEMQAIHRLYRIGQPKRVEIWILSMETFFIKDAIIDIDSRIETVKSEKDPLSNVIENNNAAFFFRRLYLPNSEGILTSGSYFGYEFESRIHGLPGNPDSVGPIELDTIGVTRS